MSCQTTSAGFDTTSPKAPTPHWPKALAPKVRSAPASSTIAVTPAPHATFAAAVGSATGTGRSARSPLMSKASAVALTRRAKMGSTVSRRESRSALVGGSRYRPQTSTFP